MSTLPPAQVLDREQGRSLPHATDDVATQALLVSALRKAVVGDKGEECVAVLETHISYVLLTGQLAYKIKKAVDQGFLDFRTLESRRFYCEEELRLNRRLAPELYLEVVAITGSIDNPALGGRGTAIEYAVKMREFAQDALASHALANDRLSPAHIDALAAQVAAFHGAAARAPPDNSFGDPGAILRCASQVFWKLRPLVDDPADIRDLDTLFDWTCDQHAAVRAAMAERRAHGFVRECHGDLHLGNIALVDDKPVIFDCIEFNEAFRWIDVMSEVAFTVMDLRDRGRAELAQRFLNAYVEITGDYAGLAVLHFYIVYRAMVRAVVARLRTIQVGTGEARKRLLADYHSYVELAKRHIQPLRPAIVITHGLSGCGKTTLSQSFLETIGAVRIRTDVERKRLHRLPPTDRGTAGIDAGLYAPEATQPTYLRALALARMSAVAGYVTIVDAAFLRRWQRQLFRELATELGVPFVIVSFVAKESTLRERIKRRLADANDASDADLAVLEHQLRTQELLAADEYAEMVAYDAEVSLEDASSPTRWNDILDRLVHPRGAGVATSDEESSEPSRSTCSPARHAVCE
jgi:aminoglycoside phosphotransferase family enzyme/predicted kinase